MPPNGRGGAERRHPASRGRSLREQPRRAAARAEPAAEALAAAAAAARLRGAGRARRAPRIEPNRSLARKGRRRRDRRPIARGARRPASEAPAARGGGGCAAGLPATGEPGRGRSAGAATAALRAVRRDAARAGVVAGAPSDAVLSTPRRGRAERARARLPPEAAPPRGRRRTEVRRRPRPAWSRLQLCAYGAWRPRRERAGPRRNASYDRSAGLRDCRRQPAFAGGCPPRAGPGRCASATEQRRARNRPRRAASARAASTCATGARGGRRDASCTARQPRRARARARRRCCCRGGRGSRRRARPVGDGARRRARRAPTRGGAGRNCARGPRRASHRRSAAAEPPIEPARGGAARDRRQPPAARREASTRARGGGVARVRLGGRRRSAARGREHEEQRASSTFGDLCRWRRQPVTPAATSPRPRALPSSPAARASARRARCRARARARGGCDFGRRPSRARHMRPSRARAGGRRGSAGPSKLDADAAAAAIGRRPTSSRLRRERTLERR